MGKNSRQIDYTKEDLWGEAPHGMEESFHLRDLRRKWLAFLGVGHRLSAQQVRYDFSCRR